MGIRGELFSTRVILQNRTYFFNVKENRLGDLYLNIVESKNKETGGFERQSVVLFAEDLQDFLKGFDEALRIMEKAAREQRRGRRSESGEAGEGPERRRRPEPEGAGKKPERRPGGRTYTRSGTAGGRAAGRGRGGKTGGPGTSSGSGPAKRIVVKKGPPAGSAPGPRRKDRPRN
ncbi:MAG: DUF3276 family protein [Treponema sp.]|jgi:hypothetical protein|nr:DUF3276 family protein [Treponema sp.]